MREGRGLGRCGGDETGEAGTRWLRIAIFIVLDSTGGYINGVDL